MAHEIREEFLSGKKIRGNDWGPGKYIYKNSQGNIKDERDITCNGVALLILLYPENFGLYQEPEKAWVYREEFKGSIEELFLSDKVLTPTQAGAIALAKEFLSRWLTYTCPIEIITELVGEENLK